MIPIIKYIPILTTILSGLFFIKIYKHWSSKKSVIYLLWWTFGILTYGLGTLTESLFALFGWNVVIFKAWYIFGAILGGVPLAQGTVHLLYNKKVATILSILIILAILIVSAFIILSPVDYGNTLPARLTGSVLVWSDIRLMTPIINMYAFIFLVGGAIYSAWRYSKDPNFRKRMIGNIYIAIGGLLPGIGGAFTRYGHTEVLYITELIGLALIFRGYLTIKNDKSLSVHKVQQEAN